MPLYNPMGMTYDFPVNISPPVARWVMPGWLIQTVGNSPGLTSGVIWYQPIFVSQSTLFSHIGVLITNLRAGGLIDLRIFKGAAGLPTSLVLSCGTVSTTNAVAVSIAIAQTLSRGYYFLAMRGDATAAGANISAVATGIPVVQGYGATCGVASGDLIIMAVTSAFADPAPAPTSTIAMTAAGIWLREN